MTQVYKEQVQDLMKVVPEFKVANSVIHFDETSPHLHFVGVPISDNNKRGMKKSCKIKNIYKRIAKKNTRRNENTLHKIIQQDL